MGNQGNGYSRVQLPNPPGRIQHMVCLLEGSQQDQIVADALAAASEQIVFLEKGVDLKSIGGVGQALDIDGKLVERTGIVSAQGNVEHDGASISEKL